MIPSKEWLDAFDAEVKRLYCASSDDLGFDESNIGYLCDLPPREAAERLGEKFDLIVGLLDDPWHP